MNLTVFGAIGGVGREVVTQAIDAGHHVTAYVRNPAKLTLTHPNLTVTAGELTDRDAVQRAVQSADAVISALGPSLDRKATGMPLVEGTHTIVDAMRTEGVERYIGMATLACATRAIRAAYSAGSSPSWAARSSRAPTASRWRCADRQRRRQLAVGVDLLLGNRPPEEVGVRDPGGLGDIHRRRAEEPADAEDGHRRLENHRAPLLGGQTLHRS